MQYSKDQLGSDFVFDAVPQRIISLVPSQSEFLWALGLEKRLVGISKFCIHPEDMFRKVARVGGTKQLDLEKIRALKPDLIIGNKEENDKTQIETLSKEFKVWMSDIYNFEDAFQMMEQIATIVDRPSEAELIINKARTSVAACKDQFDKQSVAYFIWNEPYLFAANTTFIHHVLEHIGLKNVLQTFSRYPELSLKELKALHPQFCFLSSEPFPFKEEQASRIRKELTTTRTHFVDGEMFSWYGSRLIHLQDYVSALKKELHA